MSSQVISSIVFPMISLTTVVFFDVVFIRYLDLADGYLILLITQSYQKRSKTFLQYA